MSWTKQGMAPRVKGWTVEAIKHSEPKFKVGDRARKISIPEDVDMPSDYPQVGSEGIVKDIFYDEPDAIMEEFLEPVVTIQFDGQETMWQLPENALEKSSSGESVNSSWTINAAQDIRYNFDAGLSLFLSVKDVKESSKVQEIIRMNVSNEEKLRQLTANEKEIISDAAQEKYNAVSKYAESQGLKMNIDSTGEPSGSIDWHDVLGEETAPVVESKPAKTEEVQEEETNVKV